MTKDCVEDCAATIFFTKVRMGMKRDLEDRNKTFKMNYQRTRAFQDTTSLSIYPRRKHAICPSRHRQKNDFDQIEVN